MSSAHKAFWLGLSTRASRRAGARAGAGCCLCQGSSLSLSCASWPRGWADGQTGSRPRLRGGECGHKQTGNSWPSGLEKPDNSGASCLWGSKGQRQWGPKDRPPAAPLDRSTHRGWEPWQGGQASGWTRMPGRGCPCFLSGGLNRTMSLGPQAGPVGRCPRGQGEASGQVACLPQEVMVIGSQTAP